jgi:hypothetical protein
MVYSKPSARPGSQIQLDLYEYSVITSVTPFPHGPGADGGSIIISGTPFPPWLGAEAPS